MEEATLTVTDLKQFIYCPRIPYFKHVLGARERFDSQQQESRESHRDIAALDRRRTGARNYDPSIRSARKIFNLPLFSPRLLLSGVLDLLIIEEGRGEHIPVDYKFTQPPPLGRSWGDHRVQLAAYALLVEHTHPPAIVRRGFLYYVNQDQTVEVPITHGMKRYIPRLLTRIRRLLQSQSPPPIRVNPRKCTGGCGLLWICRKT